MINLLHSFHRIYILCCFLASTCVMNQWKGRAIWRGERDTGRIKDKHSGPPSEAGKPPRKHSWIYIKKENKNMKYTQNNEKHTKKKSGWWVDGWTLKIGTSLQEYCPGNRMSSGFYTGPPHHGAPDTVNIWNEHSGYKGKQELGHADKFSKTIWKTLELRD